MSANAGRPMAENTKFVFGLLEKNADLSFEDAKPQLQAAGFGDLSESSFNLKRSQFKSRNGDSGVEERRQNRQKVNKILAKMAKLKNAPTFKEATEKLALENLTISAPSFYNKMASLRGETAPKATKKTAKKAVKANKPKKAKAVSADNLTAVLAFVRDNGGVEAVEAQIQSQQAMLDQFKSIVDTYGLKK